MTRILNANKMEELMKEVIDNFIEKDYKERNPKLVILVASDDKASERYVKNKVAMGEKFGIDVQVVKHEKDVTNEQLIDLIQHLNYDSEVDGIMLQLPVYEHLNGEYIINRIHPDKDVDGLTLYNKAKLETDSSLCNPCTPMGVLDLLNIEEVSIEGKRVVVVGKGETSGSPMAIMLRNEGTTVTICHSRTKREDLEFYIRHADIVVSCVGKRNLLDAEWFKEGSVVIGVGLSYDENGKQHLDFDFDKVVELGKVDLVSQRTNCTGKATVLSLMYNTVVAYSRNK